MSAIVQPLLDKNFLNKTAYCITDYMVLVSSKCKSNKIKLALLAMLFGFMFVMLLHNCLWFHRALNFVKVCFTKIFCNSSEKLLENYDSEVIAGEDKEISNTGYADADDIDVEEVSESQSEIASVHISSKDSSSQSLDTEIKQLEMNISDKLTSSMQEDEKAVGLIFKQGLNADSFSDIVSPRRSVSLSDYIPSYMEWQSDNFQADLSDGNLQFHQETNKFDNFKPYPCDNDPQASLETKICVTEIVTTCLPKELGFKPVTQQSQEDKDKNETSENCVK